MPPKKRVELTYPLALQEALKPIIDPESIRLMGEHARKLAELQAATDVLHKQMRVIGTQRRQHETRVSGYMESAKSALLKSYEAGELSQEELASAIGLLFTDFEFLKPGELSRIAPGRPVIVSLDLQGTGYANGVVKSVELGLSKTTNAPQHRWEEPEEVIKPSYLLKISGNDDEIEQKEPSVIGFAPDSVSIGDYVITSKNQALDRIHYHAYRAGWDIANIENYFKLRSLTKETFGIDKFNKGDYQHVEEQLTEQVSSRMQGVDGFAPNDEFFSDHDKGAVAIRVMRGDLQELFQALDKNAMLIAANDTISDDERYEIVNAWVGSMIRADKPDLDGPDFLLAKAEKYAEYVKAGINLINDGAK